MTQDTFSVLPGHIITLRSILFSNPLAIWLEHPADILLTARLSRRAHVLRAPGRTAVQESGIWRHEGSALPPKVRILTGASRVEVGWGYPATSPPKAHCETHS